MLERQQMTARFRLREILEAAGISQTDIAREADVSFATVNRLCTNATEQVSLRTLANLSGALKRLSGRRVEPGDLIERVAEKKGKRR
jgi:transcriptional regulator with XRE-family HTH domain